MGKESRVMDSPHSLVKSLYPECQGGGEVETKFNSFWVVCDDLYPGSGGGGEAKVCRLVCPV